jgi:hypothetical protein
MGENVLMIVLKDLTASCVSLEDWPSTEKSVYGNTLTIICILVVRVPGYRSRCKSSIPGTEELLGRNSSYCGLET